jgi:hypothetical protein
MQQPQHSKMLSNCHATIFATLVCVPVPKFVSVESQQQQQGWMTVIQHK